MCDPALRLILLLLLQPIAAMAQESRTSALATVTDLSREADWVYVAVPPQILKKEVLADHLFENTIPLFSEADVRSFDYTFLFYNERQSVYRVVFYKSTIDEKCAGYDAIAAFYHYKSSAIGFERTPGYGEPGFERNVVCTE